MKKHRWIRAGIPLGVLLLGVLLSGLRRDRADVVTPQQLIEKYKRQKEQIKNRTKYGVGQTESFSYEFACDFSDVSVREWNDIITVHTERHCQEESRIVTANKVKKTKKGCLVTVCPIEQVLASKSDRDTERSWGSASVYYLAIRYDQESLDRRKLDQPQIVPFTLKSPSAVPNLSGETDAEGVFRLRWSPVEGAEEYRVYNYWQSEEDRAENVTTGAQSGYHKGSLLFEKSVKGTVFESFSGEGDSRVSFRSYRDNREIVSGQNFGVQGEYYVTAVVNGQESIMSNAVRTREYRLPKKVEETHDILYQRYKKTGDLPQSVPVENTDGTVEKRKVLYTFYQGKNLLGEQSPRYAYRIEGTCLKGYVVMAGKEGESYPETVGTPSLAGRKEPRDELDKVPQTGKEPSDARDAEPVAVPLPDNRYYIKADTAAEEWLALNLVAGEDEIYVGDFPELTEPESLRDIFYYTYYQNPYVFGIAAFACDYERLVLHVEYLYSREKRAQMREEMTEAAGEILKETQLAGENGKAKTSEEKVRLLYQWLETHTEYDTKAYEDSVANRYEKTGETYEYAHNAWGMLVKRKGMCQGYSDAFLLLCHMTGVEAAAVTGSISQSIPHIWNAVCLEGSWYYMDVTNNTRNTGEKPYLYLAGEKQAKDMQYVREEPSPPEEQSSVLVAENNFYTN